MQFPDVVEPVSTAFARCYKASCPVGERDCYCTRRTFEGMHLFPQVGRRIILPCVVSDVSAFPAGQIGCAVDNEGAGVPAYNTIIVVLVFIRSVGYVAKLCPLSCRRVELPEVADIFAVVDAAAYIGDIVDHEAGSAHALASPDTDNLCPGVVGRVEGVEVFQVVAVVSGADVSFTGDSEGDGAVSSYAWKVGLLCPGIGCRIVFPEVVQLVFAVVAGTEIAFAVDREGGCVTAGGAGEAGFLRPGVRCHIVFPQVAQSRIAFATVISADQVSFIADGEAGGFPAGKPVEVGGAYPVTDQIVVIVIAARRDEDGEQSYQESK